MIDLQNTGAGLDGYGLLAAQLERCWPMSAISSPMRRSFRRFSTPSSMI